MAIIIKTPDQIEKMRIASEIVKKTHDLLEKEVKAGITTKELDKIAEDFILSQEAAPSFKGYNGFPASICTSINEEVIHGIPSLRILEDGDIISIDIGAYINGYHGDAARTHAVGKISEEANRLIEVTRASFFEGMKFAKVGYRLFDIGEAIQDYVESNKFSVVTDFVGHGIGKDMHEDPQVPNYKPKIRKAGFFNPRLSVGMTIAVEPMVNMGTAKVIILENDWTVITADKKLSAHYENTLVITDGEPLLLTF